MQVSVEKTSNLGRRLTIEVPADAVKSEEQNRLKDLAKNARLEGGFRRGSEAAKMHIQKTYKTQIHQEAVTNVLQKTLGEALKEQNLRPANTPTVEDLNDKQGENLKYVVSFEVFPDVAVQDFATITLEKTVADISDAEVQNGIKKLQEQFATWEEVTDRPAQKGDRVVIDFVGKLDGVPFENGSAKEQPLELGSNTFIPGFEDGLIGVTVDSEKTLDITFPSEYGAKHLAGQKAQFDVKVKAIEQKNLAEVNADFAKRIGIEDSDIAKVPGKVKENMLKYVEDLTANRLREQALEKLYETNPLEIPASLLAEETHKLLHERFDREHRHDDHGHDHHHPELTVEQKAELEQDAKKRITIGLLLNEIINKNNIQPEEGRILAKLGSMALMYGGNTDFLRKMYYESKELRQNVQNMVLTEQAADLVVAGATIKEKTMSFDDIVNSKTS